MPDPSPTYLARTDMAVAQVVVQPTEDGQFLARASYWSRFTGAVADKNNNRSYPDRQTLLDECRERAISFFQSIAENGDAGQAQDEAMDILTRLKAA